MQVHEAKQFLDSVASDIAAEQDPALRAWYETEVSLTPEHKEAVTIQDKLQALHTGLGRLIESAVLREEDRGESVDPVDHERALSEIDEYVTLEEKKRRAVTAQLSIHINEWRGDITEAREQTKASKRRKHENMAVNRFAKKFETFGVEGEHIVYDPDSLAIILEQLDSSHPKLAEAVVKMCVNHMYEHGVEFTQNPSRFARLIYNSTSPEVGDHFDKIFQAIYERVSFTREPELAAQLHVALASAALEVFPDKDFAFYQKIAETGSFKNSIIRRKEEFFAGVNGISYHCLTIPEIRPLAGEVWNARLVYHQLQQGFMNDQDRRPPAQPTDIMATVKNSLGHRYQTKVGDIERHPFFQNPQHAEQFEVHDLLSEEGSVITKGNIIEIPAQLKPHFYNAALYEKRKQYLAPRGLAHDMIRNNVPRSLGDIKSIVDGPVSPSLAISYGTNVGHGKRLILATNEVISQLLTNHGDKLKPGFYTASSHEQIANFGELRFDISQPGQLAIAQAYLRPLVPDDIILSGGPILCLATSFVESIVNPVDINEASERHNEKLALITDNRNRYFGRRPVRFGLPEEYKARGLDAVVIRQHPDRRHLMVTTQHDDGKELEFTFDENFKAVVSDLGAEGVKQQLRLALESLVTSLAIEWLCRPVVETSEGTISAKEQKSKVNLGFLRYLPVNASFSPKQADLFWLEQRGNLMAENIRRRPIDPDGLNRNSTYVRENYDPSKPPLEIYYDPSNLDLFSSHS